MFSSSASSTKNDPPSAKEIHQPIVRERIEIGRKFCLCLVSLARANEIQPYILKQFFGVGAVAALSDEVTEQMPFMPRVQHVERGCVAALITEHERFIGITFG
jgi:hypothetical protein